MTLSRAPKKASVRISPKAKDAWWYENAGSIDVYVQPFGQDAIACRIKRSAIEDWLNRAALEAEVRKPA